MNTTSVSLLERLRRPAANEAWARFVDLYTPLIYYWARRTGLQPCDASDLVQDVFTLLVRKLPEFAYDGQRSFRSWLRTVTLNKWRENHRRRAAPVVSATDSALGDLAVPDDPEELSDVEYRQHLARRALQLMQAEFSATAWKACWETAVNGRPAAEVAAELGVNVDVIYTSKSRVLRRLRQELDGLLS